jgi:hypothetical protein
VVLKVRGPVEISGGGASLVDAETAFTTRHDAQYFRADRMKSNGVYVDEAATDAGLDRWTLADGQRVKGKFDLAFGWTSIAFRWECCNETAVAGTVAWQLAYRLIYSIVDTDLHSGAMTNVAVPATSVGADQHASIYMTPSQTAALATPPFNLFGNNILPTFQWSLSRVAGGSLAGLVGVSVATITRL